MKKILTRLCPNLAATYQDFCGRKGVGRGKPRETTHGFKFVGHEQMEEGSFEPEETPFILKDLQDCPVFVDVGANFGYFSCLARKHGAYVLVIEPHSLNIQILCRNL